MAGSADILRRNSQARCGRVSPIGAPASRGLTFEYSEPHHAGAHHARAGRGLGDRQSGRCGWRSCCSWPRASATRVDGFLAKRFGMTTELGAYLDPLADKVLIVSIYVTLGITGVIPRWLVILVVSRDIHDRRRRHVVLGDRQAGQGEAADRSPSSTPRRRSYWRPSCSARWDSGLICRRSRWRW